MIKIKRLYSIVVHYIIKHTEIVNTNFKKVWKRKSQAIIIIYAVSLEKTKYIQILMSS